MNIKTVGKSGQISLGKALAGLGYIVEPMPGGDILLKRALVVQMNERELPAEVHTELLAARQWRRKHAPAVTDLDALTKKLGQSVDEQR